MPRRVRSDSAVNIVSSVPVSYLTIWFSIGLKFGGVKFGWWREARMIARPLQPATK
jgi:hypothetical protein